MKVSSHAQFGLPRSQAMKRFFDATLGKWVRHLFFVLVRTYYAMFYNVSAAGKHLLQDQPGTLILATHVSRHDGPLVSAILYSTARVRPTVHYYEYHTWAQARFRCRRRNHGPMIDAPRAKTTHWGSFIRCWATAIPFCCFPPERCAANPKRSSHRICQVCTIFCGLNLTRP